jgi:hypothetical protein
MPARVIHGNAEPIGPVRSGRGAKHGADRREGSAP